ncbi:hypothetical protein FACS1894161_3940 [Spirochaetia bacterium]|nr:hypothetical protein FACS1894161_3940 [Spirochaetia bacterium]
MGISIKPVQPTEIKDIKIVRDIIAQIRKPIPPEVEKRLKEMDKNIRAIIRR